MFHFILICLAHREQLPVCHYEWCFIVFGFSLEFASFVVRRYRHSHYYVKAFAIQHCWCFPFFSFSIFFLLNFLCPKYICQIIFVLFCFAISFLPFLVWICHFCFWPTDRQQWTKDGTLKAYTRKCCSASVSTTYSIRPLRTLYVCYGIDIDVGITEIESQNSKFEKYTQRPKITHKVLRDVKKTEHRNNLYIYYGWNGCVLGMVHK